MGGISINIWGWASPCKIEAGVLVSGVEVVGFFVG
jgi:hypothetical protein